MGMMTGPVKTNRKMGLPVILMLLFALTRYPDFMPQNFSAAYALVFCAGIYICGPVSWWLPLATLMVTDLGLTIYYATSGAAHPDLSNALWFMLPNYLAYWFIFRLGRRYSPRQSWIVLLGGGFLGAILFYLITNTGAWLLDSSYPKNLLGWLQALTVGSPGWPHTWEFFRNTLLSGGLFTGLFAGAMKVSAALEKEEEEETEGQPEEQEPEESPV
jgi:hypothetical protein